MALNLVNRTRYYNMAVPAGTVSGSPIRLGFITGVAVNDRDAVLGTADVDLGREVEIYNIPVTARVAIAPILAGDELYADAAAPTVVDNDPGNAHFGIALEAIPIPGVVDVTATINVIKGRL